jgi:hypothetical protein
VLNSIETALECAKTMTWRGVAPIVHLLDRVYDTGVRLSPRVFRPIAERLERSISGSTGSHGRWAASLYFAASFWCQALARTSALVMTLPLLSMKVHGEVREQATALTSTTLDAW